jgi:hypothetical protein
MVSIGIATDESGAAFGTSVRPISLPSQDDPAAAGSREFSPK